MLHYQFETIHPFEDGNGRIGRVLIPLLFQEWRLLAQPILYLSPFFEEHRRDYYDLLLSVSQKGAWEDWISFFVAAVRTQAQDAHSRAGALLQLRETYRQRFLTGSPVRTLEIIEHLFESPVLTSTQLTSRYDIPQSSAQSVLRFLEDQGVLRETTGRRRDRVYLADQISDIIGREEIRWP